MLFPQVIKVIAKTNVLSLKKIMADGAFTPGTGTLKSTTLPAAFLENALLLQTQERVALGQQAAINAAGLTVPANVSITPNFRNDTVSVNVSFPLSVTYTGGVSTMSAIDYLAPINAVVPSVNNVLDITGADLTNPTLAESLYELGQKIQQEEDLLEEVNILTFSMDLDAKVATISGTFPGVPQVGATGNIEIVATNYLSTI